MATFVAPVAQDLGGLIVSLPCIQALIASGADVRLVLRSPAQGGLAERIPGLGGFVNEPDLQLSARDVYINLRDHPLQKSALWGSPEFEARFPGYRINDIMRDICRDKGIPDGLDRLEPLSTHPALQAAGRVALVVGTAGPVKAWPSASWIQLAAALDRHGQSCFLVGQKESCQQVAELCLAGLDWLPTPTLADAVDVLTAAACVVALDTGLMHLAVHQGKSTVALFRNNTVFIRPYRNLKPIVAPPCNPECIRREFLAGPQDILEFKNWEELPSAEYWSKLSCVNEESERCMARITPGQVLSMLQQG